MKTITTGYIKYPSVTDSRQALLVVGLGRVWLVFGLAAALLMGLASSAGAVAGYGDVPEDTWYTDAVQWSVDNGIAGIAGACFAPDIPVSRGETAVWIYNMENQPDTGNRHPFTDVTDASQNSAISWMANTGVTTGTSPTTFAPDATLKRGQAAAFLHRLAGEPSAPPHGFSDVVAGWQQEPVSWMANTGITTGTSPTTFAPEVTLTRAHLITFLYRYQGEPNVTINTTVPNCVDLVVDTPTVTNYRQPAGERFLLSARVRNRGGSRSAYTTLRYYQSTDAAITTTDTRVDTDSVPRLDAQESRAESTYLTAPSEPGTYYYGACVDTVSDESDTTNNCSEAVTVSVFTTPPSAPAAPTVSSTTPTTVTIDWSRPYSDGPPNDYDIQYRPSGTTAWTDWPHVGTERTATISDLTTDVTYDVRVRAANSAGTSDWSSSIWATAATHDPPSRPTNVRWRQIGTSERVTVSWNQTPKATYYKVYHCSTFISPGDCTVRLIKSLIIDTEYTHTVFGTSSFTTTYVRYAVRACNGTGCSSRAAAS